MRVTERIQGLGAVSDLVHGSHLCDVAHHNIAQLLRGHMRVSFENLFSSILRANSGDNIIPARDGSGLVRAHSQTDSALVAYPLLSRMSKMCDAMKPFPPGSCQTGRCTGHTSGIACSPVRSTFAMLC